MIGQVLDRYRIESKLGEGGMGVVYEAFDTHLNRIVAIKILPPDKVADPAAKQRFIQEARAASALNHPGIVTIFDVRSDRGVDFIVMELVEGRTLTQLLPSTGLASRPVVNYAVQIADALARAHEAGIIHRDLKPSNVIVTSEDRTKILDFGVAKLLEAPDPSGQATTLAVTATGMVVGTLQYMSPEQAEGRTVDARSDIFSFGAMLCEMATGRKPFAGESMGSSNSPDLDKIIKRCLRHDPARRYQTMADLKVALEDIEEDTRERTVASARAGRRRAGVAVAATLLLIAGVFVWRASRGAAPLAPLNAIALTTLPGVERHPSLSPDGNQVAFAWDGLQQGNPDIYVQQVDSGSPLRLTTDTLNDHSPAWSPDGRWVAFLRGPRENGTHELRIIPPLGGPDRKLRDIHPRGEVLRLASLAWCADSRCLVVTDSTGAGKPDALFVVSFESGETRQLTFPPPAALSDSDQAISPDGNRLVFRRNLTPTNGDLYTLPLKEASTAAGDAIHLATNGLNADYPTWMPDSRDILFSARSSLWRLSVVGAGTPAPLPFVGADGSMPVVSRPQPDRPSRLVYVRSFTDYNIWRVETSGVGAAASSPSAVAIASTAFDGTPQFSPDGRRVAFASNRSGKLEIWMSDRDGANAVQLTSMGAVPGYPTWSPDGELIAFHSNPEGQAEVFVISAAGGKPKNLTAHPAADAFPSFSRDGRWLYFSSTRAGGEATIWKVPPAGGDAIQVTRTVASASQESRDGGSIYYVERWDKPTPLWRLPVSGGDAVKLIDDVAGSNFAIVDGGIYYIDRGAPGSTTDRQPAEARLEYFDLATRTSRTVARYLGTIGLGLGASPDGRTILYSRLDSSVDDLMLVENFR